MPANYEIVCGDHVRIDRGYEEAYFWEKSLLLCRLIKNLPFLSIFQMLCRACTGLFKKNVTPYTSNDRGSGTPNYINIDNRLEEEA